ncbi:MAG: hypothetical protein ACRDGA_04125, partial [Bacteroidota bacterium]
TYWLGIRQASGSMSKIHSEVFLEILQHWYTIERNVDELIPRYLCRGEKSAWIICHFKHSRLRDATYLKVSRDLIQSPMYPHLDHYYSILKDVNSRGASLYENGENGINPDAIEYYYFTCLFDLGGAYFHITRELQKDKDMTKYFIDHHRTVISDLPHSKHKYQCFSELSSKRYREVSKWLADPPDKIRNCPNWEGIISEAAKFIQF